MAQKKQTEYKLDELNNNGEYIKIGGSPLPGITLKSVLRGHSGVINRFEWSHNGKMIAAPNSNGSVIVWNVASEIKLREILGHEGKVYGVAWSLDDNMVASAGWDRSIKLTNIIDGQEHAIETNSAINALVWIPETTYLAVGTESQGVQFWDTEGGKQVASIRAHDGNINNLSISPNGRLLATASGDQTIVIWDIKAQAQVAKFSGFGDWVFDVAWSPDGKFLCSCSWDKTIRIWDIEKRNLIGICEGHEANIESISYSCDGKIFASKSHDSTVRLWNSGTFAEIAEIMELSSLRYSPRLRFHPSLPMLATAGETDEIIRIWTVDTDLLISNNGVDDSVKYSSAKVVLLGDSGVGKTGLGWRLAHNEFKEQSSTHGQQFWVIPELSLTRNDGTECEAVLWDLAGQHSYRPIHSIFLDNVDASLLLFDASNRQDPLKGIEFWLNQLTGKSKLPPSILVGARSDVSPTNLPKADLERFCQRYGISGGFISASAKTGEGLDNLMEILKKQIPWDQMTATVTTVTFKRIKNYVLALKEKLALKGKTDQKDALVAPEELHQQLQITDQEWQFTNSEMMAAVGHLQTHGYVSILRSSAGRESILLAPHILVNLASSIVLLADKNPQELGSIKETELLQGKYAFDEIQGFTTDQQHILIDAAILRFLDHSICFRETLGNETLLIFPGLIKQKRPLQDEFESVDDVSYIVRGRVENIYALLVVLLGYTSTFTRINQWQNQAQYEMGPNEVCGFRLSEEREGELELILYYSIVMPSFGRTLFQGLFESFLYKRDVEVTRIPPVFCPNEHRLERATVLKRIRDGKDFAFCDECGKKTALPEIEEPELLGAKETRQVQLEEALAKLRNIYEANLVRVKGFRRDRAAPSCYISHADDQDEWITKLVRDLRDAGISMLEEQGQLKENDFILQVCTPTYKELWSKSTGRPGKDIDTVRRQLEQEHVIPLLREGNTYNAIPGEVSYFRGTNFTDDATYVIGLFDLVMSLYAIPLNHHAFRSLRETLRWRWKEAFEKELQAEKEVFISYAWGKEDEEHEAIVNDVVKAFQERGVTIIQDKRDLRFRGSIREFMETIAEGKAVILVISEKYLKSPNCCFELVQIAKYGDFKDRIFPIVLNDANIYDPVTRLRYVEHWENKKAELDELMKRVSAANMQGFREDIDLYTEIRALLPNLMNVLKDMNSLTPEIHRQSGFIEILDAVMARLGE